jgi:hypothetical protein
MGLRKPTFSAPFQRVLRRSELSVNAETDGKRGAVQSGFDIYIGINTLKDGAHRRRKRDIDDQTRLSRLGSRRAGGPQLR